MKKWQNYNERMFLFNPELFNGLTGTKDEKVIKLIQNHFNNVTEFFKKKKKSKFIRYHIIDDKIEKLNKYIDTKNLKFPIVNSNNK